MWRTLGGRHREAVTTTGVKITQVDAPLTQPASITFPGLSGFDQIPIASGRATF